MTHLNINSIAGKVVLNAKLTPALLLILSTLTLTTAASAAELVVNGGFEEPVVDTSVGWTTYYGKNFSGPADCPAASQTCNDGTLVPGWFVFWTDDLLHHEQLTHGRLEIQTGNIAGWPAYNGSLQKAELDSHHRVGNDNNNVTILQFLPTCPLTAYTLSYAWKSRTTISGDNDVRVIVGDTLVNLHAQNHRWKKETVHFISDASDETLLLFGSIGDQTTTGMFLDEVSVIGLDGSDPENCPEVLMDCDNKPLRIALRYDGDPDSDHNQQSDEVIISPDAFDPSFTFPDPATIKVYGHNRKKPDFLGEFEVAIDDIFTVRGPRKRIPPRMTFEIYDSDDVLVQTVTFHTSCSQPLDAGDEFGAITVWGAN